jgi:hypothetical protein
MRIMLVRTVQCLDGQVEIELVCDPIFDFRAGPGAVEPRGPGTTGSPSHGRRSDVPVRTDLSLGIEGEAWQAVTS